MVISCQGVVTTGHTLDVKHYNTGYFTDNIAKPHSDDGRDTEREIWRALLHSLYFLWLGVHPLIDMYGRPWDPLTHPAEYAAQGKPLPGVCFGVVHIITGDLDEFAK